MIYGFHHPENSCKYAADIRTCRIFYVNLLLSLWPGGNGHRCYCKQVFPDVLITFLKGDKRPSAVIAPAFVFMIRNMADTLRWDALPLKLADAPSMMETVVLRARLPCILQIGKPRLAVALFIACVPTARKIQQHNYSQPNTIRPYKRWLITGW